MSVSAANLTNIEERKLKNVLYLTVDEKKVLATKLKAELGEFKERERMYIEKRKELQDLENSYRKKQDQILG
jgi:hypothetical protein